MSHSETLATETENTTELVTITIQITPAQKSTLAGLRNPYVKAVSTTETTGNITAYDVIDDREINLYNIAPDGSYTYETMLDGFHHGWTLFNEDGQELDESGDVVPGGRIHV